MVLREVGPGGVLKRDAVRAPLIQGMAADLHRAHRVPVAMGVQQTAQLDQRRRGESGVDQRLARQGEAERPDREDRPPVRREDRLQILHRGGLAVGARDAQKDRAVGVQRIDAIAEARNDLGPIAGVCDIDAFAGQSLDTLEHAVGDQHGAGAIGEIALDDLGIGAPVVEPLEEEDRAGITGVRAPLDVLQGTGRGRFAPPSEIERGQQIGKGVIRHGVRS